MRYRSKYNNYISLAIKTLIILCAFGYIYKQIFYKSDFTIVSEQFQKTIRSPHDSILLILVVIMMFLNWSLETYKWQLLISKIEKISFFKALQGVLAGVTVSCLHQTGLENMEEEYLYWKKGIELKLY